MARLKTPEQPRPTAELPAELRRDNVTLEQFVPSRLVSDPTTVRNVALTSPDDGV